MKTQRAPRRAPFAPVIPKEDKPTIGRTAGGQTPLNVRTTGLNIDDTTRERIRLRFGRKLSKFALHIERATVRFVDINGPRGGVDKTCRIKVVLSHLPSVVLEETAGTVAEAFDRAVDGIERAVRRSLGRSGMSAPKLRGKARRAREKGAEALQRGDGDGSLIGRRVGQARANLEHAADRPEKRRRDVPVDTSEANRSATDRKVGAGATAKRNTKLNDAGMTSALEDSAQDRPSRKSTRKSADRSKRDSNLRRRQTREVTAPKARARRAAAKKA